MPETINNSNVPLEIFIPVNVANDIVDQELKCPICLDTMQATSTVTSCLHRFCSECLHKSLRGNLNSAKEHHDCPSCRNKLPSKRSTRPDGDFDNLIQLISKSVEKQKQEQQTVGKKSGFDARPFMRAHEAKVAQFRAKQKENRKQAVHSVGLRYDSKTSSSTAAGASSSSNSKVNARQTKEIDVGQENLPAGDMSVLTEATQRVHLALLPWDPVKIIEERIQNGEVSDSLENQLDLVKGAQKRRRDAGSSGDEPAAKRAHIDNSAATSLQPLPLPFLRVPPLLRVIHLKQYLVPRLKLTAEQTQALEIIFYPRKVPDQLDVSSGERDSTDSVVVLDNCLTLADILHAMWDGKSKFRLYYRQLTEVLTNGGGDGAVRESR